MDYRSGSAVFTVLSRGNQIDVAGVKRVCDAALCIHVDSNKQLTTDHEVVSFQGMVTVDPPQGRRISTKPRRMVGPAPIPTLDQPTLEQLAQLAT